MHQVKTEVLSSRSDDERFGSVGKDIAFAIIGDDGFFEAIALGVSARYVEPSAVRMRNSKAPENIARDARAHTSGPCGEDPEVSAVIDLEVFKEIVIGFAHEDAVVVIVFRAHVSKGVMVEAQIERDSGAMDIIVEVEVFKQAVLGDITGEPVEIVVVSFEALDVKPLTASFRHDSSGTRVLQFHIGDENIRGATDRDAVVSDLPSAGAVTRLRRPALEVLVTHVSVDRESAGDEVIFGGGWRLGVAHDQNRRVRMIGQAENRFPNTCADERGSAPVHHERFGTGVNARWNFDKAARM